MNRSSEALFAERARRMAAVENREQRRGTPLALFRRHRLLYGLRLSQVLGAGRMRSLSPAPGAAAYLAGLTLHRGRLLSLVDLPTLWGHTQQGMFDLPSFVVVGVGKAELGVLTEELVGLFEVDAPISAWEGEPRVGVSAVTQHERENVIVLDAQALVTDPAITGGARG